MEKSLTMEDVKERLDHLEALTRQAEGDPDRVTQYWDELSHLRQVYDRMIMDSQGRGIQMMQDIMDKSPETRENYVAGVPVASGTKVEDESGADEGGAHSEPEGSEAPTPGLPPNINLTIVVNNHEDEEDESMKSNALDARAAELAKSGLRGDVRIPLNLQREIMKSCKEKKSSVDAVDQGKIREMNRKLKDNGEEEDEDEEKPEAKQPEEKKAQKSMHRDSPIYRSESNTLEKSRLKKIAARRTVLSDLGAWSRKVALSGKTSFDVIAKAMKMTLEKGGMGALAVGSGTIVAGMPEKKIHKMSAKEAYSKIVHLNCEIACCEEKMLDANDPETSVELHRKLRDLNEELAEVTMASEGLGLKTEDMSRDQADPRFKNQDYGFHTPAHTDKSQKSQDLSKAISGHKTGQVGKIKYALTYWGEGGLSPKIEVVKFPSTDKAVSHRLATKIPPLPKMQEHVIALGGDENAPISKKHATSSKGKHAHERTRDGKIQKDAPGEGKQMGHIKHVVSHGNNGVGGGVGGGKTGNRGKK